ncbi:MAG: hypothetical protein KAR01_10595 [Desulfocapsa sp.]|nr:hypothetical protein [Desulfocapsa sp.]
MKTKIRDKDLQGVEDALRRAGTQARKIAEQTNTPLVIYKHGQIVREDVSKKRKIETT